MRLPWAPGLVVVLLLIGGTAVEACGDKLLALSRGVRFQRAYAAARPASILIYLGRNGGTARQPQLYSTLRQAGHKVRAVEEAAELDQALNSGSYDIVLADPADAPALADRLKTAATKPTVIPVFVKPKKSDLVAAEKQYGYYLPGNPMQDLLVVDIAMRARVRRASAS